MKQKNFSTKSNYLSRACHLGVHLAVFVVTIFLTPLLAEAQESVSVLLQKGLFAEETEGDLEAAIAIYNDIVKQTDQSRAVAAQALYRLSLCHLKLGDKEKAQASLNKLVEEYTDQESLVALAKKQLEAPTVKPESDVVVRLIWKDAIDPTGRVSSDGRYYAYIDWNTGNVAVRDLKTGEDRDLSQKGDWKSSEAHGQHPIISPNGDRVACLWYKSSKDGDVDLRVMPTAGGKPQVIKSDFAIWFQPDDWSPDGKQIIGRLWESKGADSDLVSVSIADGSMRRIKALGTRHVSGFRLSPDGRYLAFHRAADSGRMEKDLFLIDMVSGEEATLLKHPANEAVVAWTKDGSGLLFRSDRLDSEDLWYLPIGGGVVGGEPVLIKAKIGDVSPLGLTVDGSLFYGVFSGGSVMFQASVDLNSGKLLSKPKELGVAALRQALSPDGTHLASWVPQGGSSRRPKLVLFDLDSEFYRDLWLPSEDLRVDYPVWSKDGRYLFQRGDKTADENAEMYLIEVESGEETSLGEDRKRRRERAAVAFGEDSLLYDRWDSSRESFVAVRRDLKTGSETEYLLLEKPKMKDVAYDFAARHDLQAVYYAVNPKDVSEKAPAIIYEHLLETGRTREVSRSGRHVRLYPSPTSSLLAVTDLRRGDPFEVRLIDLSGNAPREAWVTKMTGGATEWGGWTPDGQRLLFQVLDDDEGVPKSLWTISVKTGRAQKTDLSDRLAGSIHLRPDGKSVIYRAYLDGISEVWRMDDFLSQVINE